MTVMMMIPLNDDGGLLTAMIDDTDGNDGSCKLCTELNYLFSSPGKAPLSYSSSFSK